MNPIVGVVVPTMQNRVFTEVLSGINATLNESGLRPVFGVSEYSLETEEDIVFDLLSWRPKGQTTNNANEERNQNGSCRGAIGKHG